jgi:hypothetical protein
MAGIRFDSTDDIYRVREKLGTIPSGQSFTVSVSRRKDHPAHGHGAMRSYWFFGATLSQDSGQL